MVFHFFLLYSSWLHARTRLSPHFQRFKYFSSLAFRVAFAIGVWLHKPACQWELQLNQWEILIAKPRR